MSALSVYSVIRDQLNTCLAPDLDPATRERIALLVMGILGAKSASPARIARALSTLGLVEATVESTERRIRRIENDPQITAAVCLHPLCRHHLAVGKPQQLLLILDPTTQEDRVVMLSVAVWYRGRALPLGWAVWPGNQILEGERFWERVQTLLESLVPLLPLGVPVIWLADRAFGTPTFLDRLQEKGFHFVVRVQDQTRYRDARGREQAVRAFVWGRGQRRKGRGELFKKQGWRALSLVVLWGRKHRQPLCLVSNLAPQWELIALYQRRYPIEALFRDYKSSGWQWEQGQVTDLQHLQRLLVGMALATWMAVFAGTMAAQLLLREAATGGRRTRAWVAKYSLFQLGLEYLHNLIYQGPGVGFGCVLRDWEAPSWQRQHHAQQVYAFIFGRGRQPVRSRSRHN
jgi:hypothetical protein